MGLRMAEGIVMPAEWISTKLHIINDLSERKLLMEDNGKLTVTASGRPILNGVINALLTG
jgi:hypothetical protein